MRKHSKYGGVALSISIYAAMIVIALKIIFWLAPFLIILGIIIVAYVAHCIYKEYRSPSIPTNATTVYQFDEQAIANVADKELNRKLQQARKTTTLLNTLYPLLPVINIIILINLGAYVCLCSSVVLIALIVILARCVSKKVSISVQGSSDSNDVESYEQLFEVWRLFFQSQKTYWVTYEQPEMYPKTNAGRSFALGKKNAKFRAKLPRYIKSTSKHFTIYAKGYSFIFFPGLLIIVLHGKIYAIENYKINIQQWTEDCSELDFVPEDTIVSGHTWKFVNKNGSPDRRYNNNFSVPICKYGFAEMRADGLFSVRLMCSNCSKLNGLGQISQRQ